MGVAFYAVLNVIDGRKSNMLKEHAIAVRVRSLQGLPVDPVMLHQAMVAIRTHTYDSKSVFRQAIEKARQEEREERRLVAAAREKELEEREKRNPELREARQIRARTSRSAERRQLALALTRITAEERERVNLVLIANLEKERDRCVTA